MSLLALISFLVLFYSHSLNSTLIDRYTGEIIVKRTAYPKKMVYICYSWKICIKWPERYQAEEKQPKTGLNKLKETFKTATEEKQQNTDFKNSMLSSGDEGKNLFFLPSAHTHKLMLERLVINATCSRSAPKPIDLF